MKKTTKQEPKMWGSNMVGFGPYHYKYESGREGNWPLTGFSPRKQAFSLYFCAGLQGMTDLLKKSDSHKSGKGCLYIKKPEDIDVAVLKELIKRNNTEIKKRYK